MHLGVWSSQFSGINSGQLRLGVGLLWNPYTISHISRAATKIPSMLKHVVYEAYLVSRMRASRVKWAAGCEPTAGAETFY